MQGGRLGAKRDGRDEKGVLERKLDVQITEIIPLGKCRMCEKCQD